MRATILDNIPFDIDLNHLFDILHVDDEDDDAERVKQLVNAAKIAGNPKGMYRPAYIETRGDDYIVIEGVTLTSRALCVNLESIHKVFPYVVTCGKELEDWSSSISDMFELFWADSIKEQILYSAIENLFTSFSKEHPIGNTSIVNPGSLDDWPVSEQLNLFRILGNVQDAVGVELTDSYLMLPFKSVSGIIYSTESRFDNFQL